VLRISDDVWSEFFAEHFGQDPYRILGAYQHMVAHPLYLPDYAIGQMISHQVRAHVRNKDIAAETKRICSIGRLTPAAWMKVAVGGELSAMPLIRDSERAIKALG
jgi:oligoendopeptidase F